jgi:hypothetical protein
LFRSDDEGESWSLVRSLWDHPSRSQWFGGGYDHAGIHSVLVDPRDPEAVTIGISCAGAWHTGDGGATWEPRSIGMTARYLPVDGWIDRFHEWLVARNLAGPGQAA